MLQSSSRVVARQIARSARLYSSSAAARPRPVRSVLGTVAKATALLGLAYAGGVYYSSSHPAFQRKFTTYVPGAATVIDFLEEREYKKTGARASISSLLHANDTSSGATNQGENTKPFANAVSHPSTDTDNRHHLSATNSSADPLSPTYFFNAVSGQVGSSTDHDYLPLVLLPDDGRDDPLLKAAALNLNDLIASFNSGTLIPESTIISVSSALADIPAPPRFAELLRAKSDRFQDLSRRYRLMWESYLDTQDQIEAGAVASTRNPVLADYNRSVRQEIQETENLLVRLVNSGKAKKDLDAEDGVYLKYKQDASSSSAPKRSPRTTPAPIQPAASAPTPAQTQQAASTPTPSSIQRADQPPPKPSSAPQKQISYGALDASDPTLQLTLSLTLLVSALHQHAPGAATYIQSIRDAVTPLSEADRKERLTAALREVRVPDDVDLGAVLGDIVR